MKRKGFALTLLVAGTLITGIVSAATLDKIQFIKISPKGAFAVIKSAEGKLTTIKTGDTVAENVTVKEIIPSRVVLEERTDRGVETLIVRIEGGKTRIDRTKKAPEFKTAESSVENGK